MSSCSTINPQTNLFNQIPEDVLVHCFSFLTVGDLCRIGYVSKSCLQVSEENWRQTYFKRRHIVMWSGPPPSSWRRYIEKTKALFPFDPIQLTDLQPTCYLSEQETTMEVLNVWKQGFANEAVIFAQNNAWSYPLRLAKLYVAIGRTAEAETILQEKVPCMEGLPTQSFLDAVFIRIFSFLNKRDLQQALCCYKQNREELIISSPVQGWYLSRLVYASLKENNLDKQFSRKDRISFPKKPHRKWNEFFDFLQGFCLVLLGRAEHHKALTTLQCIRQMMPLLPKPSTEIPSFEQCLCERILQKGATIEDEMQGDFFVCFPEDSSGQYKRRALDSYIKAFERHPSMHLEFKRAFCAFIQQNKTRPSPQLFFQFASFACFHQSDATMARIEISELSDMVEVVICYSLDRAYSPMLKNIRTYRCAKESQSLQKARLYYQQLQLHFLAQDFIGAGDAWSHLFSIMCSDETIATHATFLDVDMYDLLYQLIEGSIDVSAELRRICPESPQARLAKAYTYYTLENYDKALQTISGLAHDIRKEHLEWLYLYSQKDVKGMVIYSLFLQSKEALKDYFSEMFDFHVDSHFFIYHNLATRLYFLGHPEDALEPINIAIEEDAEEPAPYIIKGLIHQYMRENALAERSFKTASELCPEKFPVTCKDYAEEALLLLPK